MSADFLAAESKKNVGAPFLGEGRADVTRRGRVCPDATDLFFRPAADTERLDAVNRWGCTSNRFFPFRLTLVLVLVLEPPEWGGIVKRGA
jgi:hypothetical protein